MKVIKSIFLTIGLILMGSPAAAEPERWNVMHWDGCYQVAIDNNHGGICYESANDAWEVADGENEKEKRKREDEPCQKWEKIPHPSDIK